MTTVLVIDDEPSIVRALRINLRARGYEVHVAYDGTSGLSVMARERADVVIVDLGLPDIDGVDVITGIRGWSNAPIIVLTARDQEPEKVLALDAGADDYVTKPFGMDELLARIRAAERRALPQPDEPIVRAAHFTVDLAAKQVRGADGAAARLTPTEWHIVELLARHPDRLVTARQLLHEVWGPAYDAETHYLRVYLAQLRRKLEPDPSHPCCLITDPGMGYRLVTAPTGDPVTQPASHERQSG